MKRWLPWVALVALVVGFANFLWVWVESATVGDALQGRIENGVETDRSRLSGNSVKLLHREAGVPAGIRLFLADDDPVIAAIRALVVAPHEVETGTMTGVPSGPEPYPMVFRVAIVLGLAFSVFLIVIGISVVFPRFGPIGFLWTGILVAITATNIYRYLIRDRDRW